jgi:diaminopimelate decarboxylase
VLYRNAQLPADLAEGDRVWFGAAGVYTTACASGFNGFDPVPTQLTDDLP